jgi:hypothetical protein
MIKKHFSRGEKSLSTNLYPDKNVEETKKVWLSAWAETQCTPDLPAMRSYNGVDTGEFERGRKHNAPVRNTTLVIAPRDTNRADLGLVGTVRIPSTNVLSCDLQY